MMIENEIQRKIEDFRELGLQKYIPRESNVYIVDNMVTTIIGARRSGKSFRTVQIADEYINKKAIQSIHQICLLDFDNPILSSIKSVDLRLIQNTFLKMNPDYNLRTTILFILDEIHKIMGWEEYVIDLSKNPNWKVIVTGSSSKLLKHDISTELRGKAISSIIFPLTFKEFLKFKNFQHQTGSTKGVAELQRRFDEFLKWGAFPAITNVEINTKEVLLREYFDTMILKDIIQRFNISKPRQCTQLYYFLLSNIGKPHSYTSAFNYIKQSGYKTSRDTIREYINWAVDSWLIFLMPIFSDSIKEQERNYKKLYCIDWALSNKNSLVWDGHYSRSLENIVFISLYQKWPRVNYYLTRSGRKEVDFIAVNNAGIPEMAVQVCMDISNPETFKRELVPLIATAKYFNTKENVIITYNQEKSLKEQGVSIKAIPAWKWLLN